MFIQSEDFIKILLAILLGGLIGAEREARDKSAGFRTIILYSVGATLFTMFSLYLSKSDDPTRIASSIVTAIGFLGAGAIVRNNQRVSGLTTAATIWLAAAVGMSIGSGNYILAVIATVFTLLVLRVFPAIEAKIDNLRLIITDQVVFKPDLEVYKKLESTCKQQGLKINSKKRTKLDGKMLFEWETFGSPKVHDRLVEFLLQAEDELELNY
jgi:putative Mg2+ transporter-C (MgtC) family protein